MEKVDSKGKYFNANSVSNNVDNVISDGGLGFKFSIEQMKKACQLLTLLQSGSVTKPSEQMAIIAYSNSVIVKSDVWLINNGATCHFTNYPNMLVDIRSLQYECLVGSSNEVNIQVLMVHFI